MTDEPQQPQDPQEPDPVDQSDDVAALRSEAANRRRQVRAAERRLQEVEQERDELLAWRHDRERGDIEQVISEHLADASDFWAVRSLDDLRGEDGSLDLDRARAEVEAVVQEKPHWAKPSPEPRRDLHQGVREDPDPPGPSFGQAIRRAAAG